MPRARQQIPTYLNRRGRGAVIVYRGGVRTEITLPGKFGSKESKLEYESILAHLRVAEGDLPEDPALRIGLTIGELIDKFMDHAEGYYVHTGTKEPTGEMAVLRAAFRALLRLHFRTLAATFGPLALKSLRNALITGAWHTPEEKAKLVKDHRPIGLARKTANHYVSRIKLLFTWGVSEEFFPSGEVHPFGGWRVARRCGSALVRRWLLGGNLVLARCNLRMEVVTAQALHPTRERSAWTRQLDAPIASGEAAIPPGARRGASAGGLARRAGTRTCRCADACTSP